MNMIVQMKGGNPHRNVRVRPYAGAGFDRQTQREIRLEQRAEELLEDFLHRRRWSIKDRDMIAEFLAEVVRREIVHEGEQPRRRGAKGAGK